MMCTILYAYRHIRIHVCIFDTYIVIYNTYAWTCHLTSVPLHVGHASNTSGSTTSMAPGVLKVRLMATRVKRQVSVFGESMG